jgi:hypothetical protein
MPNRDDDKTDAQKDYDTTAKQADRLKLKGKDRDDYIHRHMRGYGYKMVPSYVHPDDEDDDEGGGFFRRSRRRNRDEDDDGYPF